MKIGILTFHRAFNYGAVLQCYALQEYLKSKGHNVFVIDYRQHFIEKVYFEINYKYILSKIRKFEISSLLFYIRNIFSVNKREKNFILFRNKYLCLTNPVLCSNEIPPFDIYIIGSDQVWGLQCTGGLDPIFFGNFKRPKESLLIGYAISSNKKSIETIGADNLNKYCMNFSKLSFREESLARNINLICKKCVDVCLDPTLLPDVKIWTNLVDDKWKKKNYILIYQVRNLDGKINLLKNKAKILSSKIHCDIIDMSLLTYSPMDFISAIKYAKCVITTSFHATVFSILFRTPLCCYKLNDGHDDRYVDLLTSIGAECFLFETNQIPEIRYANYDSINEKLYNIKLSSVNYLDKINEK